jgi:hypothetical protein
VIKEGVCCHPLLISLSLSIHTHTHTQDLGVLKAFNIPMMVLQNFLERIRNKYKANPYHNWHHGFAVLWFAYYILRKTKAASCLNSTDMLALLVATVCHDVDHTGFTNSYEVAAQSGLALTYNDRSVLENHHCFVTFEVLRQVCVCVRVLFLLFLGGLYAYIYIYRLHTHTHIARLQHFLSRPRP